MFRKTLLATTALVLCSSVGFAAHQVPLGKIPHGVVVTQFKGIPVQVMLPQTGRNDGVGHINVQPLHDPVERPSPTFNNLSKDVNAKFLSWYGFIAFNEYSHCKPSICGVSVTFAETEQNALPITGAGLVVKHIAVPIYAFASTDKYHVGLYSAPGGTQIGGGNTGGGSTSYCCTALKSVGIGAHTLTSGTTYYVEVTANLPSTGCSSFCYNEGLWLMEDTNYAVNQNDYFNYAYTETTSGGFHTAYNSGWNLSQVYPVEGAAEVH